jgi:tripartite-type tricarboxylate transporter receptor subunit TctC
MTPIQQSPLHTYKRRSLAAGLAIALSLSTSGAWAQKAKKSADAAYPSKPVTLLVPQTAGGTNDFVARVLAAKLAEITKQGFVVENKPGAGGNVGTQLAAKAPADGYTLLVTINSAMAINPALYKTPGFDPIKDFVPIGLVATVPNVLVVNSATPYGNLESYIKAARAAPNTIQYASAGNGTLNHLLGEMLGLSTGIKIQHIPYKGVAPALNDILGGQVSGGFASLPSALPHIKSGKLRALGVSGAKRSAAAPDIPAIGETVRGYGAELWVAVFAPAGTPEAVTRSVEALLAKALDDKDLQAKLAGQGAELTKPTYGKALTKVLREDMVKWDLMVKASGAKVD